MTPIQMYKFMQEKSMDIRAFMILEILNDYVSPMMTNSLAMEACALKLCSPATTYKYIKKMKAKKYIKEIVVADQDRRCAFLIATDEGKKLLGAWQ